MSKQRLILIDGSSFLFRAYHAIPPLTNSEGLPTNAIYGVSNMLRKLVNSYQSDYFTVVFDAKGKTFRHDLYPDYKAQRPPMDNDLRVQIEPLQTLIKTMGFPLIIEKGVEADDVLGSLAQYAEQQGFEVVISTGDKDMAQLVTENITLENSMSNTKMTIQGVIDKFGVKPEQIVDYLALMGDTADNIPGIPKVGTKTAAKWLSHYQTMEKIIDCAEEIKGKVGESLRANMDQLALSKTLTTLKTDLNLPYTLDDLKCKPINDDALIEQVENFGFSTWLKQLRSAVKTPKIPKVVVQPPIEPVEKNYQTILTQTQLDDWFTRLQTATIFAFDTETTGLDYTHAEIVGISFAITEGEAAYVPFTHDYLGAPKQLNREKVLTQFKPLLESSNHAKVGQNLKYDAHVLKNHGIHLAGIQDDTMLASYVLNSIATKHNMDDLAKFYLNIQTTHYEDIAGKGVKQLPFQKIPIDIASPYAAEDADITLRLYHLFSKRLKSTPTLETLYQQCEVPLIKVLTSMEENGVLIDADSLATQSMALASQLASLEQQIHDLAGQSFNLNSPKQIQMILYEKLELPILKKTPKGQPSTAESVLQTLAQDYHLPKLILEYRSLNKLKSTYTDKLPQQINPKTHRVHTFYHQAVTATGRLSSSNPNLQNIPIRTALGRQIRQAFIAPEGYKIVAADYSQIELRIMAHLSQDEGLLNAFSIGKDIHIATAAEVFGVEEDQVTPVLRRSAKAINFGLIYGMSAFGLAQQLGIKRGEAQSYIDLYFKRYPKVKQYMEITRIQAKEQGYVETLLGRRLYLPDINSSNRQKRQYAERTAINAPMQGTAADIIKRAMLASHDWIQQEQPDVKMIMQVHDELVFEIHQNNLDSTVVKINTLMSSAITLAVPLIVEIGMGNNWDEAH
jgi:DNA polymerase-1